MAKWTPEQARAAGAIGGRRTYERHGPAHMQRIGVRGFWRMVERHWAGNPRAAVEYFISIGLAATDAYPGNGAFEHRRPALRVRAELGVGSRLPRYWKPPAIPADLSIEPPF